MRKYHKINSLYMRDEKGDFTNEFARPEFEYLFDLEWVGTEKVDGTNISIQYVDGEVSKFGRSDKSKIPEHLDKRLDEIISTIDFKEMFGETSVYLYGEGYGHKIQSAGKHYLGKEVDFILFDVMIGQWWLNRESVDEIANELGLKAVPVVYRGTLRNALDVVKNGMKSQLGDLESEGMVLTPKLGMFARNGDRIICKIKGSDFRKGHYKNIE